MFLLYRLKDRVWPIYYEVWTWYFKVVHLNSSGYIDTFLRSYHFLTSWSLFIPQPKNNLLGVQCAVSEKKKKYGWFKYEVLQLSFPQDLTNPKYTFGHITAQMWTYYIILCQLCWWYKHGKVTSMFFYLPYIRHRSCCTKRRSSRERLRIFSAKMYVQISRNSNSLR